MLDSLLILGGKTTWLIVPILLAGLVHIAVVRGRWLKSFAWPIDGGRRFRGRRIFGDNKTFRGFVVMTGATAVFFGVQVLLCHLYPTISSWGFVDYRGTTWWRDGGVYGLGYVIGELPNSFLKRQLQIGAGQRGTGKWGPIFLVLDHIDSYFGLLLTMSVLFLPSLRIAVAYFIAFLVMHLLFNVIAVLVGVKVRVF